MTCTPLHGPRHTADPVPNTRPVGDALESARGTGLASSMGPGRLKGQRASPDTQGISLLQGLWAQPRGPGSRTRSPGGFAFSCLSPLWAQLRAALQLPRPFCTSGCQLGVTAMASGREPSIPTLTGSRCWSHEPQLDTQSFKENLETRLAAAGGIPVKQGCAGPHAAKCHHPEPRMLPRTLPLGGKSLSHP